MPVNDPDVVRNQYASEHNLRARQALYREWEGPDPREVAWEAIAELGPRRVLEVGGGPGGLSERMTRELCAEVQYLVQGLRDLVGWQPSDFESLFSRANGAELLNRHFASVEQRDVDAWATVRERATVLAYRESLSGVDALDDVAEFDVPLRIRCACTVFIAAK
jgi:hypothetical protein